MTGYITRFAPSPTGNLHIGSARTAFINYIITKQNPSSKLYLRIEDTDKKRSKAEFTKNILEGLSWLGIEWENEIQIQSKRIERHKEVVKILLKNNNAYKCNCSEEKLSERREIIQKNKNVSKKICTDCKNNTNVQNLTEGYVVRLKIPDEGELIIEDKIQGNVNVKNKELDDFILLRKDQTPTYMLSVVVDDNDLGINFIIRGDDHLNNAFRQNYIYKFLNWEIPKYAHIPLIHGEDGSKLSKRHGAVDVLEFKRNGYLKEAIINNLILLGWSPKNNNEIIGMQEIINLFDINNISKSSSIFSYSKLNFFNNHYLRSGIGLNRFKDYCLTNDNLIKFFQKNSKKMEKIFDTYKKDLKNFDEISSIVNVYFDDDYKYNNSEKFSNDFNSIYTDFINQISAIEDWTRENIQKNIELFLKNKNIQFPVLGKPIRFLLINSYNGPSISDIFVILGKKDSIRRLNQYIDET